MRTIRLNVRQKTVEGTDWFVARMEITRPAGWSTCGVFQLLRAEWELLEAFCTEHKIEVQHEEPEPVRSDTVQAEGR